MKEIDRQNRKGFTRKASQTLLLSIVLALGVAGCASKATKQDSAGLSGNSRGGAYDGNHLTFGKNGVDPLEQAVYEAEVLEGFSSVGEVAAAHPNAGVYGTLSQGFSGTWGNDSEFNVAQDEESFNVQIANIYDDANDSNAQRDWEREMLVGLDPDSSSPEQLAERVAAARRHALNIATEDEDPSLYAALTGGRDLFEDIATGRALTANQFGLADSASFADEQSEYIVEEYLRQDSLADYADDPSRDYQRRGFFDEEGYAFAPNMSESERIAARVEAARRHSGVTGSDDEMVTAFAQGNYSRIYDRDADVNGLIALDSEGRVSGWAAPGENTADGSVFAFGGSERMLANLQGSPGASSTSSGQYADGSTVRRGSGRDRRGAIDVAAAQATVNEDMQPQTLGGALPMVLGVDENGHFDFDTFELRDEVKSKLDELATQLQDAEFDRLDVVGHSDRIGDAGYNKALSHRRALAVGQYLRDRGVPEYKIKVVGRGDEVPVTQYDDCASLRGEEKIACLQPDRRVEIAASIRRMSVEVQ